MPASMMSAPAGSMRKVSGRSIAIVAGGPSPGRTPTTVPRNTPTKHHRRFMGSSATPNPVSRREAVSTSEPPHAHRELDSQRQREHQIEPQRARHRDESGHLQGTPVHHGHEEEREQ